MRRIRATVRETLGPKASEGSRQFWFRAKRSEGGAAEIARTYQLNISTVWRWIYGDRIPIHKHVKQIEKDFGIAAGLWHRSPRSPYLMKGADP